MLSINQTVNAMKKMMFIMACVLITGLSMQSCKSNDAKVQEKVEKALQADYESISSTLKDGIVTLTGVVDSQAEKIAVGNLARSVKEVKSVVNNITVRSAAPAATAITYNDDNIRSGIANKLTAEGYKDIQVEVRNGEVNLSGELKRDELKRVMQIANETQPRKVNNNLILK